MIKIFLVLALAVLTSSSALECPEAEVSMGGEDFWFSLIPYVESWEDCGRICSLTTLCNFWSLEELSPGGTAYCYLYQFNDGYMPAEARYISGEKGCPAEDQEEV